MKFHHRMIEKQDHLLVLVGGKWRGEAGFSLIDLIASECRRLGCERVLIDGNAVYGELPDLDRFIAGERIAAVLRGIRMALVCQPHYVTKFSETVAVNRGAMFFTTADPDQAMRWLMSGSDDSHATSD
jgi:hypothetical protein